MLYKRLHQGEYYNPHARLEYKNDEPSINYKEDMPIGAKSLLLKNTYLLDLHHKNDEKNTIEAWKNILRTNKLNTTQK